MLPVYFDFNIPAECHANKATGEFIRIKSTWVMTFENGDQGYHNKIEMPQYLCGLLKNWPLINKLIDERAQLKWDEVLNFKTELYESGNSNHVCLVLN